MMSEIPDVQFYKKNTSVMEFEVIPFKKLFSRIKDRRDSINQFHRIHFYQILFFLKGDGDHFIDFKKVSYHPGSLILISADQVQSFDLTEDKDGFILIFTEDFMIKNMIHPDSVFLGRLFNSHIYPSVIHQADTDEEKILPLILEINTEFNKQDPAFKEDILRNLLRVLILKIQRIQSGLIPHSKNTEWVRLFIEFKKHLKANIFKTRNALDYAQILCISYKHLNLICKELTEMPAKKFIDHYLLLEIKKDLASSELSVKELSYKYGFDEPTNFVKYFRKNLNQTPAQFRSLLKNL